MAMAQTGIYSYPSYKAGAKWPVYAITIFVGLFVLIVTVMWLYGHVINQEKVDETGWIILGACVLRMFTILIALASIQNWGEKIDPRVVFSGLWGAASAQLVYPVAELVGKTLMLIGLLEHTGKGLGNMTLTGWFNLGMVWLIFGLPGFLFIAAAVSYKARKKVANTWAWLGGILGISALLLIGLLIG